MDASDQNRSVHEFERAIFPIWKGIEEREIAADGKLTGADIYAPGQILFECATLHKQDLAILASGVKPHRQAGDREYIDAIRRRDTRVSRIP